MVLHSSTLSCQVCHLCHLLMIKIDLPQNYAQLITYLKMCLLASATFRSIGKKQNILLAVFKKSKLNAEEMTTTFTRIL